MDRQIIISVEPRETRVGILEDNKLQELLIERMQEKTLVGNIYKGIVRNVLPAIQAAFVDIGFGKNGFLHVSDITNEVSACREIAGEDVEGLGVTGKDQKRESIDKILQNGQEVLVQIIKEPIGTKGVRLSSNISIAGRHLVMMPGARQIGISRRIADFAERRRLRTILKQLSIPKDMGFIVRTVGQGATQEEFEKDIRYLVDLWQGIQRQITAAPCPSLIHEELSLILRVLRDLLTEDVSTIVVDSKDEYQNVQRFVTALMPNMEAKISYHGGREHIFDCYGIDKEIEKAQRRKVWLKCGGYIVIEQTEAMVVIDVNSGRCLDKKNLDDTILETNLQAADEASRQIRLRNIGGIIIIDFIDMRQRRHQRMVEKAMEKAVKRDKAKTNIFPISPLGILQMTRERVKESLSEAVYEGCPYCGGFGRVKSVESMSIEAQRLIKLALRKNRHFRRMPLRILAHPNVIKRLEGEDREAVRELEKQFRGAVSFEPREDFHIETVRIQNERTGRPVGDQPQGREE
ncbi:MAG: Rne/Rng family ribonuclease [Candidatus Aureabacteria bacterium]|nr:Rne/Rng family ribonuclease [Candidatus Auribacterota bacterium]